MVKRENFSCHLSLKVRLLHYKVTARNTPLYDESVFTGRVKQSASQRVFEPAIRREIEMCCIISAAIFTARLDRKIEFGNK